MSFSGRVLALHIRPRKSAKAESIAMARAVASLGIEGDHRVKTARSPGSRRQVLLLEAHFIAEHGRQPGDLREQITLETAGRLSALAVGTRLRIGEALFEISGDCEPCTHIGKMLGVADPEAFMKQIGNRGRFARVIESGWIHRGQALILEAEARAPDAEA